MDYDQLVQLDVEDLAEQGILEAYEKLMPRLKQYVDAPIVVTEQVNIDAGTYSVFADGKTFEIWEDGAKNSDGWERATVAFFEMVNANLSSSDRQFYALYGGNDLSGVFLSLEEFATARRAIRKRSNWPWRPVHEPPHYGYPVDGTV
ncbi:MAG: hypothetical protein SF172_16285 [Burkholderiales bacterium]|nr:hypothetical protein [Burkholderiales bacterium]